PAGQSAFSQVPGKIAVEIIEDAAADENFLRVAEVLAGGAAAGAKGDVDVSGAWDGSSPAALQDLGDVIAPRGQVAEAVFAGSISEDAALGALPDAIVVGVDEDSPVGQAGLAAAFQAI